MAIDTDHHNGVWPAIQSVMLWAVQSSKRFGEVRTDSGNTDFR